jgi:hypothetical protein
VDFVAVLEQVTALLRQRGRLTYSTLKRQFPLDDAALEDGKNELIEGQRLAVNERSDALVWTGTELSAPHATAPPASTSDRTPRTSTFPSLALTPHSLAEPFSSALKRGSALVAAFCHRTSLLHCTGTALCPNCRFGCG